MTTGCQLFFVQFIVLIFLSYIHRIGIILRKFRKKSRCASNLIRRTAPCSLNEKHSLFNELIDMIRSFVYCLGRIIFLINSYAFCMSGDIGLSFSYRATFLRKAFHAISVPLPSRILFFLIRRSIA